MKNRCAQCGGKLGLGVRFKRYFDNWSWTHKRFCSNFCAHMYDQEVHIAKQKQRAWIKFLKPHSAD